ncbi:SIMPL domain-containing protein [Schleiferia thermophila]|uniref:SIMPL domain-containing protein n=1 Tax=Schleiferia thermophila TaxID=884107 RepID=UPI003EEFB52D
MKKQINLLAYTMISLAAIVIALLIRSAILEKYTSNHTIAVTGLGSVDFDSDLIVWSGTFSRIDKDLKKAYAEIEKDRFIILQYLISKGIKESSIVFQSIQINKEFDHQYDDTYNLRKKTFVGYNLSQSVTIESDQVDVVEEAGRSITELINQGIEFYSASPQYFYTKLAELKLQMIETATLDANKRARILAENSGNKIGKLKRATLGVFQIVGQNSGEDFSWGGTFNTFSRKKTAHITVKLEYLVD